MAMVAITSDRCVRVRARGIVLRADAVGGGGAQLAITTVRYTNTNTHACTHTRLVQHRLDHAQGLVQHMIPHAQSPPTQTQAHSQLVQHCLDHAQGLVQHTHIDPTRPETIRTNAGGLTTRAALS